MHSIRRLEGLGHFHMKAILHSIISASLLALALGVGCGPALIDDSSVIAEDAEITDTPEHRAIIELVDNYRRALEDKDIGTLRRLISSDYYENAGTNHSTMDDYGYDGLNHVFDLYSENVRQLRLSVLVREIELQGDRANVYVDFVYNMLYVVEGQERWQVDRDLNRLELVREGTDWRVVAGL